MGEGHVGGVCEEGHMVVGREVVEVVGSGCGVNPKGVGVGRLEWIWEWAS